MKTEIVKRTLFQLTFFTNKISLRFKINKFNRIDIKLLPLRVGNVLENLKQLYQF